MAASVVIPVRNGAAVLGDQLRALSRQRTPFSWEVIVADNGSTDTSATVASTQARLLPSLSIVDAGGTAGVSHARNAGAVAARGSVIVFCDADDEVAEGWLAALVTALNTWPVVGGVLDRRRLTERTHLRPDLERSSGLAPWPRYLPFCSGANLGVRREVFDALGGFDESFVAGGDDVDFSWRAAQAGYDIGFVENAVVHYRERTSLRQVARQAYGYGWQDPHLYAKHQAAGMPRNSALSVLSSWVALTFGGPRFATSSAARRQWASSVARRIGRVAGSIAYRTLYL